MAKSAPQRLLGLMRDVLEGILELLRDPDARAGAGLNPDVSPDTSTAQPALDRIGEYFNSESPSGEQYLRIVDDVFIVLDALTDMIGALQVSGFPAVLLDYLNLLLELDGLNVVRSKLPYLYYFGRLVGFVVDKGTLQVVHRLQLDRVDLLLQGIPIATYYSNILEHLPSDQLKVDFTLGAFAVAVERSFRKVDLLERAVDAQVFYGWDSLPAAASPADKLFERSASFAFKRRQASNDAFETCPSATSDPTNTTLFLNLIAATAESGVASPGVLASLALGESFDFDVHFGTPEKVRGHVSIVTALPLELHLFIGEHIDWLGSLQPPALSVDYRPIRNSEDESIILVGSKTDWRLEVGRFSVNAEVRPLTSSATYGFRVKAEDAALVFVVSKGDGLAQKLLGGLATGGEIRITFELALGARSGLGFFIEGGTGLRVTLALGKQLGPLRVETLVLGVNAGTGDTGKFALSVELAAGLSFNTIGVGLVIDQMGLDWSLVPFGKMGFKPPKGVGIALGLGPVSGGGYLFFDRDKGQYAGAVWVRVGFLSITGVGLIQNYTKPDGSQAYAFVVILSLEFTLPLFFGFTLNGVGGLFGQNRGVSAEALQQGIKAGVLDSVLFPKDVVGNAPRIIAALSAVFPLVDGQTILGLMLKVGWGGSRTFVELALGLIFEFESPKRTLLLGKATADFPTKENPILHLELDCVGIFNPTTGESSFDAALYRSKVGPYTIVGDIVWRSIGGVSPFWILAIGGINPHFVPPQGVLPPMNRVGINLVDGDNPRAFLSGYTALTSNTFQIGGSVEAAYSKAGFSLSAHIGADALINTATFAFIVDFSLSVAIKRGSHSIASIGLSGTITGPKPFRFDGTATLGLFFFDVHFHVSFSIGSDKPEPLPSLSVSEPLLAALNDSRNWSGSLPTGGVNPVSLSSGRPPTNDAPPELMVHPLGELSVRERVAPLDFEIQRYSDGAVDGDNTFSLSAAALGDEPATGSQATVDLFAVGDFLSLSDHEKLSRPSFESLPSGLTFVSNDVRVGEKLEVPLAYKTILRKKADPSLALAARYSPSPEKLLVAAQQGAAAQSSLRSGGLQRFAGPARRLGLAAPAFSVASTATLKAPASLPEKVRVGTTYAQAAQALAAAGAGRRTLQIVGKNELVEEEE